MSPNDQFTIAFSRMTRGWAVIHSFRRIGLAGIPYAAEIVAQEDTSFVADLANSGKLSKLIIGIRNSDDLQRTASWVRKKITEIAVKNAACSIDAASFVFAHSVLDDGLSAFLQITAEVARDFWEKRLEERKVSLAVIRAQPPDKIAAALVRKEVGEVRRNASLIEKCDLLHAICKPSKAPMHDTYRFDQGTLSEIDKLRHRIVHGDLLGSEISAAEQKLDYLRQTWMFFFVMMHQGFGLQIDPEAMSRQVNQLTE